MANGRNTLQIKRTLKVLYPAALQAGPLLRSLLALFPTLEFDHLKRDLHYLMEKRYVERVVAESENDNGLTPWRRRWFRLTTTGVEVADRCIQDPALEE
jgi:hypothetical protein